MQHGENSAAVETQVSMDDASNVFTGYTNLLMVVSIFVFFNL